MGLRTCRLTSAALALALALAPGAGRARADGPDAAQVSRAQKEYEAGAAAYQLGHFDEAAQKFEASYELVHYPTMLFDIAQSYRRLYETGKDEAALRRAVDLYKAFLRDAPRTADKRPVAEQLLPGLEKMLELSTQRRLKESIAGAKGRAGVALADQLLEQGDVDSAVTVLDGVLAARGNSAEVVVAALSRRAACAARLGHPEQAVDLAMRALSIDPAVARGETAAPWSAARERMAGRALAVTQVPPGLVRKSQPVRIGVAVESDPLLLVRGLAAHYRLAGGGAYSVARAALHAGALEIPGSFLAEAAAGTRIEYYVTALGDSDAELVQLGSPSEPFVLFVAPAEFVDTAAAVAAPPLPWYRRGWVWAVAGGVVAGSVTAVLLTRGGSPDLPLVRVPTN
jgi:tetratricopeptide (TPR) repeat protein